MSYPEKTILVREHPEYNLSRLTLGSLLKHPNVVLASSTNLQEIFNNTEISVAAFSSTLVEGLVHNAIPFVLNFSSAKYSPDNLESGGLGIVAQSFEEACEKMDLLNFGWDNQLRTEFLRFV